MQFERANFCETITHRGRLCRILSDDLGYTYSGPVETSRGRFRWRCSKKTGLKCAAFVMVENDQWIIRKNSSHNHSA